MGYLDSLVDQAKQVKTEDEGAVSEAKKELVEEYEGAKIYRFSGDPVLHYEVHSPHFRGAEKKVIKSLMNIAIGVLPPIRDLTQKEKEKRYFKEIRKIIDETPELNLPENSKDFYAKSVVREMIGYGIIDPLTRDDQLEEIMVNGPNKDVYVYHRKYGSMKTNVVFYEDEDIRDVIDRIARNIGRRIDTQVPILDARLPDGTRVNATLPPISLDGATLTLRKFRQDPMSVVDLVKVGTMDLEVAAFLWLATDGLGVKPANTLISGGTASGKTTTLNVLCSFIPNRERVLSIEDTAELNLPLEHWLRFEVRPPSMEGTGEINMNDLVKNALRMRPDRIIVGEIRGAEGYTMFAAMNTGHSGSLGTVHANSARETLIRLLSPPISVPDIMLTALNLILMQNRIYDRRKGSIRRITELAEIIPMKEGKADLQILYSWDPVKDELIKTGRESVYLSILKHFTGMTDEEINAELSARKAVLEKLVKNNVRKLDDVCFITHKYLVEKKINK